MTDTNSGGGSYYTTPQNSMKAFDKLPPSARRALAFSNNDWAVQPVLTRWRNGQRGWKTGPQVAERVAEWDRKESAKYRRRMERGK